MDWKSWAFFCLVLCVLFVSATSFDFFQVGLCVWGGGKRRQPWVCVCVCVCNWPVTITNQGMYPMSLRFEI